MSQRDEVIAAWLDAKRDYDEQARQAEAITYKADIKIADRMHQLISDMQSWRGRRLAVRRGFASHIMDPVGRWQDKPRDLKDFVAKVTAVGFYRRDEHRTGPWLEVEAESGWILDPFDPRPAAADRTWTLRLPLMQNQFVWLAASEEADWQRPKAKTPELEV